MDSFDPVPAPIGGLLIGASAALLLILNGSLASAASWAGSSIPPTAKALGESRSGRLLAARKQALNTLFASLVILVGMYVVSRHLSARTASA